MTHCIPHTAVWKLLVSSSFEWLCLCWYILLFDGSPLGLHDIQRVRKDKRENEHNYVLCPQIHQVSYSWHLFWDHICIWEILLQADEHLRGGCPLCCFPIQVALEFCHSHIWRQTWILQSVLLQKPAILQQLSTLGVWFKATECIGLHTLNVKNFFENVLCSAWVMVGI